jgi:hypothetical protein
MAEHDAEDLIPGHQIPGHRHRGTGIAVLSVSPALRPESGAEVHAEPLPHPPDRLVHLGHAARAQDERVLTLGNPVGYGRRVGGGYLFIFSLRAAE